MPQTATQAISRTAALLAVALAAAGAGSAGLAGTAASAGGTAPVADSRVVVTSLAGDLNAAARAVQAAGGRVLDRLSLIGGVSAVLPSGHPLAPGFRVVPDSRLHVASMGSPTGTSGAVIDNVRAALGLAAPDGEGAGVTVAVVDTGVADVPDLAGRITHLDYSGEPTGSQPDGYGHGTFVAGLIAGNGSQSTDAKHAGIAPAARLLDVKVADASGNTSLIQVLEGLQAVAAHPEVKVLNLSLSSDSPLPYQVDPLDAALEALWRHGVSVVVPAGNDGPAARTITSPGSDPVLITTGALQINADTTKAVADWSSVGPAPQDVPKPDLVAPGAHVVSLLDPGSVVATANPKSVVDGSYFLGSGTSFSTAVTSGAIAALLTKRPDLTPDQVKAVLTASTDTSAALANPDTAGAGSLDLLAAYTTAAPAADPGSAEVAHGPDQGDAAGWARFLDALVAADPAAAASSWSHLSASARNWAASSWSALHPDARNWAVSDWGARNWAGASAQEWAARNWAARNWAARNWAASSWSASSWSARNWAASSWSARNWAAGNWAAGNWAAGNWAAGNWAASSWSGLWR